MWALVKRKIKVIRIMGKIGGEMVQQLNDRLKSNTHNEEQEEIVPSRFIISPGSYWNMIWNTFVQCTFTIYIFVWPILISLNVDLQETNFKVLLVFDIIFSIDRVFDLLVGYCNPNGVLEHRLLHVLWKNISFKFFLEQFVSYFPMVIYSINKNSLYYTLLKLF